MDKKLFVGNLSQDITEEILHGLFSRSGSVISVSLIKDRATGLPKGFAFIEMSNQVEAEQAVKDVHGTRVNGRQLKVKLARPPEEHSSRGYNSRSSQRNTRDKSRRKGGSSSYYN